MMSLYCNQYISDLTVLTTMDTHTLKFFWVVGRSISLNPNDKTISIDQDSILPFHGRMWTCKVIVDPVKDPQQL